MQAIDEQKHVHRGAPAERIGFLAAEPTPVRIRRQPGRRLAGGLLGRLAGAVLAVANQNARLQGADAANPAGSPARQRPRNLCEFDYDYYVNLRATHRQPLTRQRRMETSCSAPA